jgi:hypothetical protein
MVYIMSYNNMYARQKKYILKISELFKRVTLIVPKIKEKQIKDIAKKMREDFKKEKRG